jgi:hypothetical protein
MDVYASSDCMLHVLARDTLCLGYILNSGKPLHQIACAESTMLQEYQQGDRHPTTGHESYVEETHKKKKRKRVPGRQCHGCAQNAPNPGQWPSMENDY